MQPAHPSVFPSYDLGDIPALSARQMQEVDRLMVQHYQIDLLQMMELAGRHLAHLARLLFLGGEPYGKTVLLLAGKGGNGGGAMACARRLATWGAEVVVGVTHPLDQLTPAAAHQRVILQQMQTTIVAASARATIRPPDLIIDGLIGYQLQGAPRDDAAQWIRWANDQPVPLLALDLPSGLDATTGEAANPTIQATATMTLALPKTGLVVGGINGIAGALYLADIGVPPTLYSLASLGLAVPSLFAQSEIIQLP